LTERTRRWISIANGFSNLQEYPGGTDPNDAGDKPLRITAITRESDDVRGTWQTFTGATNALQATPGDAGGNYGTKNFADIFALTNVVSAVTNYLDAGAATNVPAFDYRIRLVP
jgi:hypothetical protein